jgi:glycosyltransferase involved in cell wall biosynthesis
MSLDKENIRTAFRAHKICVIVPTFNNGTTIETILNDLLQYTDQVLVVNDGSTDNTKEVLSQLPVEVVGYEKNQGKGWAIRQGFKRATELGYDYAITIDSDGQHFAEDLAAFTEALLAHPNAIIIGARNMEQHSVPGKSSFGNKFSNFWFWFETGLRLPDTQSGYRLYPIKSLKNFSFCTRKYEFEIEVLVRVAWSGIEVVSVPVKVFYPEKEKRISHFRPFWDFFRISVLNTVLVTITLLYIKPRDFFRSIKKKTSGRSLSNNYSTRISPAR